MSAYSSRKRQEANGVERAGAVLAGLFIGFLLGYIAMAS